MADRGAEVTAAADTPVTLTFPVIPRPFRYAVVVASALAILAASISDPGDGVPRTVFGVGFTIYLHLFAYAGLAAALGYASVSADRRVLLAAAIMATGYGAAIELLQGAISYRTMAATDGVINAIGAVLGAALWRVLTPLFGVECVERYDQ